MCEASNGIGTAISAVVKLTVHGTSHVFLAILEGDLYTCNCD
jgi:hypothetical protein